MDPNQVAATQANYNTTAGEQSQAGSMVNQNNPYGSLSYSQTGTGPNGVPIYTATSQLSPQQQQLLNTLQGTQNIAGQQGQQTLAGANYGAQNPGDVIGNMTSGNTKALLDKETTYLQPQFDHDLNTLDTKLKNQGFAPGQPGYDQAMNALKQSQGQTVTGFLAQAEPAAYSQATSSYLMPLNLATSEMGLSQPGSVGANLVQTPQLSIGAPNYTGAVSQYETANEQNYQNQMQQQNAMMSGLFGLGGNVLGGMARSGGFNGISSAIGGGLSSLGSSAMAALPLLMSDRRLKKNIVPLFKLLNGLTWYAFNYIWSAAPQQGLMADEVEAIRPWAVFDIGGGFKAVNYAEALA